MSLTSVYFFLFLIITAGMYYLCPKLQKYILAIASLYFYISVSPMEKVDLIALIIYIVVLTYFGGLLIERLEGKWKKVITFFCVSGLVAVLFITKYAYNLFSIFTKLFKLNIDFSWLQFGAIIGISYFILSAIGYLIDISWGLYKAERNIAIVLEYVFFFPQVISGPVTRFSDMGIQFKNIHKFDSTSVANGIRRMLWGYFQKLVISERFAIIVQTVYRDYSNYSGIGIIGATLCYAVQLYTDFSGCMDIVMGASQIFGITLPENFKAPFFSKTIQEFWQRWHITLGTWFKDYVTYPVQKTQILVKLGKKCKKVFGKKIGKKIPFYISMLVLWFLLGIWHGATGYYFMASAVVPFILLMGSDLLEPFFNKINVLLNIDTSCSSWSLFQRLRTVLLVCICWLFVCAESLDRTWNVVLHMISNPIAYTTLEKAFEGFSLDVKDMLLMAIGVGVLMYADSRKYEGDSIQEVLDRQNIIFKWIIIYLEILVILMYGMVGTSSFIYFQF